MDVAFKRVEPGEDVPPPPKELTEWAGNTAAGTLGGMCYGAFRARYTDPASYVDVPEIVAKRQGGGRRRGVRSILHLHRRIVHSFIRA